MAKKRMSTKKALAVFLPSITVVVAIMLVLVIAASMFWEDVSLFLYGREQTADAAVLANGEALCEDIVEEGTVLLKNEEDENGEPALPLKASELEKVNVFGWAAYDWMTMAFGSGYANTDLQKIKFFPALEEAGIGYNEDLYNLYKDFYTAHSKTYGDQDYLEYRGGVNFGSEEIFVLREPSKQEYMSLADSIRNYSDVGLVVIGRTGSESKDLELKQVKQISAGSNEKTTDTERHYLELSTEEEDMIAVATELCEKVIVILNTANTMETGFLDDDGIDGALLVGITGISGTRGLVNVLRGFKDEPIPELDSSGNPVYDEDGFAVYQKNADGSVKTERVKVSPSGRTADTYAYDILGTTPSAIAQGDKGNGEAGAGTIYANCTGESTTRYRAYVDYSEDIYIGYKWFETANEEGFFDDIGGYYGAVQWPFGYGLSYTQFDWTIEDVKVGGTSKREGTLSKDDVISVSVKVTNTADPADADSFPGADVVELYYTAPYSKGGIEKASVVLGAFAKTKVLAPAESQVVVLELPVRNMASYDCYDRNQNGHTGYELDAGDYQIKLMLNSHDLAGTDCVLTYTLPQIDYDTDPVTGNSVENRFTNPDGKGNDETIDEADLDGSHEETPVQYLSRADFKGTYPERRTTRNRTAEAERVSKTVAPSEKQLEYAGYLNAERSAQPNGLLFKDVLGTKSYDDEIWGRLIANITDTELVELVKDGYFKTAAIESIKKVQYVDLDGPLGFNTRVTGGNGTSCMFMAYPSGTMLAQTWSEDLAYRFGVSVGKERKSVDGLRGWYAPGANLHRNPFGGRNGEYYSEDSVLSGYICAGTVRGAKDMGVYSYVKHFAVNDSEYNREGLFTFLTEQNLRETYLRPFEIMIKEGGGNALMTAMNRLGRVWTGGNRALVTEIARDEWGFRGTIVTDWMESNETYMPPYRGIWAGNDIWLTNGLTAPAFDTLNGNKTAYKIAEHVAHDVLWTLVDTFNAEAAYDPSAAFDPDAGASYNMSWIWYVVLVEVVLAAGVAVMGFFLGRTIVRNRKAGQLASAEGELPEGEPSEEEPTEQNS